MFNRKLKADVAALAVEVSRLHSELRHERGRIPNTVVVAAVEKLDALAAYFGVTLEQKPAAPATWVATGFKKK